MQNGSSPNWGSVLEVTLEEQCVNDRELGSSSPMSCAPWECECCRSWTMNLQRLVVLFLQFGLGSALCYPHLSQTSCRTPTLSFAVWLSLAGHSIWPLVPLRKELSEFSTCICVASIFCALVAVVMLFADASGSTLWS